MFYMIWLNIFMLFLIWWLNWPHEVMLLLLFSLKQGAFYAHVLCCSVCLFILFIHICVALCSVLVHPVCTYVIIICVVLAGFKFVLHSALCWLIFLLFYFLFYKDANRECGYWWGLAYINYCVMSYVALLQYVKDVVQNDLSFLGLLIDVVIG